MKLKTFFLLCGWALLLSSHIIFGITFVDAYADEDKEILVTVNDYGEADIELVLLGISTFLGTFFLVFSFKKIVEFDVNEKENNNRG